MSEISGNPAKVVLAVIIFLFITQAVYIAGLMLTMSFYRGSAYAAIWSTGIIAMGGSMPDTGFLFISLLSGVFAAFLFIGAYTVLGNAVKKSPAMRGMEYGFLVFLAGFLPASLFLYLTFEISEFVIIWAIENLIVYVLGGLAVGFVMSDNEKAVSSP